MTRFSKRIVVARERDQDLDIIVGNPDYPGTIDADDGQRVAVYVLEDTKVYRSNPSLEPLRKRTRG